MDRFPEKPVHRILGSKMIPETTPKNSRTIPRKKLGYSSKIRSVSFHRIKPEKFDEYTPKFDEYTPKFDEPFTEFGVI